MHLYNLDAKFFLAQVLELDIEEIVLEICHSFLDFWKT